MSLLLALVLAAGITGRYEAPPNATLELHVGHDGQLRGHLLDDNGLAALDPIRVDGEQLVATARHEDDSRTELRGTVRRGSIRIGQRTFTRKAVERPATANVRRAIFAAYEALADAVQRKDFDAFQALRTNDFATIPPDSAPRNAEWMAARAAGFLAGLQPPIRTRNDILTLTIRGDEAIAVVRQHLSRKQPNRQGVVRRVETSVTQRETWHRTPAGWKLTFVDEVHDPSRWAEDEN